MPPQITCTSALPCKTEKHENCIFTQMLHQCIVWVQPSVRFLQSFWLTTHTHAAVCVQPTGLLEAWLRRKEFESIAGVGVCLDRRHAVFFSIIFAVLLKSAVAVCNIRDFSVFKTAAVCHLLFLTRRPASADRTARISRVHLFYGRPM